MFEHLNISCPLFMTQLTFKLTKIMLKDSYKIERIRHLHPAYDKTDLLKVRKATRLVHYNARYHLKNIHAYFKNAGHIPGSASIIIEVEGKRVLYTGDIRLETTDLMKGADLDYGPIDIMIIESTYGSTTLPDRKLVAEEFLATVEEVVKRGGTALIPVFSVGRAQDILLFLSRKRWDVPIYLDGLCRKVTAQVVEYPDENLNNVALLKSMFEKVRTVSKPDQRKGIAQSPGIIITTSGMMQGGPVMQYAQHMWGNPKNAILLTGFQCKRTNGRLLLDEKYMYIDGWKTFVKCDVEKFDFSGHADQRQLHELIDKVAPKTLIIQHGDHDQVIGLSTWAKDEFPHMNVLTPNIDDSIEF
jgi:putative mRNA 3-end processing factor